MGKIIMVNSSVYWNCSLIPVKHIYLKTRRVCLKLTMQTIEGGGREKMETETDNTQINLKLLLMIQIKHHKVIRE